MCSKTAQHRRSLHIYMHTNKDIIITNQAHLILQVDSTRQSKTCLLELIAAILDKAFDAIRCAAARFRGINEEDSALTQISKIASLNVR